MHPNFRACRIYGWLEILAALSRSTTRIGLIATASTTYSAPYDLARRLATIDHLSGGRAGWNIVTTRYAGAAGNFGLAAHPNPADRYARAEEFVEVVTRLWDSWDGRAVIGDQEKGVWADTDLIRPVDFHGRFFDVSGALTLPRSPQGRPAAGRGDLHRARAQGAPLRRGRRRDGLR